MTATHDVRPDSTSEIQTDSRVELGGSIWFDAGGRTLGGAARIALLDAIGRTGSITAAAKVVGLSYKAAWDAVDAMNNLAGEPLVVRATGGRGGGGTTLTPRAQQLIATFAAIEREHRQFLARASVNIADFDNAWQLIGRLGLKTSARNQLAGTVSALRRGAVNDEVTIALPGGQQIVAVLTRESTDVLGLRVGLPAVALIKASWITLATGVPAQGGMRLSARNQLAGTVVDVKWGAVNADVTLELPGGVVLAAVITNESVDSLALAPGVAALAIFKASSVIVGVDS